MLLNDCGDGWRTGVAARGGGAGRRLRPRLAAQGAHSRSALYVWPAHPRMHLDVLLVKRKSLWALRLMECAVPHGF